MDSRFKRSFLMLFIMAILALLVDHYHGRWFRVDFPQAFAELVQPLQQFCIKQNWEWCSASSMPLMTRVDELPNINQQVDEHHGEGQYLGCDLLTVHEGRIAQQKEGGVYTWVDDYGITHFSDGNHAPAESKLTQYTEPKYNFELHIDSLVSNPPPFFRDRLTSTINQIDQIYRQYLPKRTLQPIKVNLMLAGNLTTYNKLKRQYASTVGASQGFYSSQHNLAAVWHREDAQAFRTAIHETVHVINAGQFGHTPRWFNEGMAEYFESPAFLETIDTNNRYDAIIQNNASRSRAYRVVDESIPLSMGLSELLTASDHDWQGQKQTALYQHAHSFMAFLFSTRQGRVTLKQLLLQLSEQRCQVKAIDELFTRYPGGINQLNHDWKMWR